MLSLANNADAQSAQDVTTWHNDINRTGWQQNETTLNTTNVATNFGLLWRYAPIQMGHVFAQPLAVGGLPGMTNCSAPCSLVFIADEKDNLFAFNAASSSQTPVWILNLASAAAGYPVDCTTLGTFGPCEVAGPSIGITGTPVIDTTANPPILYAVAAVFDGVSSVDYDLFAVDVETGSPVASVVIGGTVLGLNPGPSLPERCATTYPTNGQVLFDSNHIQRSALLLLGNSPGHFGTVYVAFAPSGTEWENGWVFAYSLNGAQLAQGSYYVSTPHGTGGGIWGSGAGPASDGSYIYAPTGNGTFHTASPTDDYGDSLLKLTAPNLTVADYYAPFDVNSYGGETGRCINDIDFGSGGVMAFPGAYTYNRLNLLVNADKESQLYFSDRNNLGQFNPSGGNNIATVPTPPLTHSGQGYWASPAYWQVDNSGTYQYYLYYAVTTDTGSPTLFPYQMYQYSLQTTGPTGGSSGPILTTGSYYKTTITSFCPYSPTPSVSSSPGANGTFGATGTGLVWAIEDAYSTPNCGVTNDGHKVAAVLHAFNAASMSELYNSSLLQTKLGLAVSFSTPMVFQGRVYIGTNTNGTQGEVDVFGLCSPTCLH